MTRHFLVARLTKGTVDTFDGRGVLMLMRNTSMNLDERFKTASSTAKITFFTDPEMVHSITIERLVRHRSRK